MIKLDQIWIFPAFIYEMFEVIIIQQIKKMEELQNRRQSEGEQWDSKYNTITYEMRKTLIEMVSENGLSIYRAAKILSINHSTAKAILRKYRRNGHIFKRKHEPTSLPSESPQNQITGLPLLSQAKPQRSDKEGQGAAENDPQEPKVGMTYPKAVSLAGYYYYYYFPMISMGWPSQIII